MERLTLIHEDAVQQLPADARYSHRRALRILSCLIILPVVGCGSGGQVVDGKVMYGGVPIADGRIALRPQTQVAGARTVQAVITNGDFSFSSSQKILPGTYSVVITGRRKSGRVIPPEKGTTEVTERYEQFLPAQYNTQTELALEIDGDKPDLLFELKAPSAVSKSAIR